MTVICQVGHFAVDDLNN